jgi:3',5'-nucleoside bisphosphate phosphatase
MPVDLHLHTVHSDGNWTPQQLIDKAVELKLRHIAVTDHDTTAGIAEAVAHAGDRIEIIPGIEINTIWEHSDGSKDDIHILGYFLDPENAALKKALVRQQDARTNLLTETIEKLSQAGVHITIEDIQACAGIGSVGRPHITQAIVKAGGAVDVNEAFDKYMKRKSPYYVARKSIGPVEAIHAIKAAGGTTSIAHPGKEKDIHSIIATLKQEGLDAIEAYHRRHSVEQIQHYIRLASKLGMLITGGSDCHGPYKDHPPSIGTISIPIDVIVNLKAHRQNLLAASTLEPSSV